MCDQQSLRSACAYAQSDQSLCYSFEYSVNIKLLTEHQLAKLKNGLHRLVRVYTCQNTTLLEITCRGSYIATVLIARAKKPRLALCLLGDFVLFLFFCRLVISFNKKKIKQSFINTLRVTNGLDPDQAQRSFQNNQMQSEITKNEWTKVYYCFNSKGDNFNVTNFKIPPKPSQPYVCYVSTFMGNR